jgi:hypothetical protein
MKKDHVAKVVLYIHPENLPPEEEKLQEEVKSTMNKWFSEGVLLALETETQTAATREGGVHNSNWQLEDYKNLFERRKEETE